MQLQHALGLKACAALCLWMAWRVARRRQVQQRTAEVVASKASMTTRSTRPCCRFALTRESAGQECAEQIGRIQNQGACGSCWAQAAVATLADRTCIATNGAFTEELSAQAMIDCDAHNDGCGGGYTDNAWRYLVHVGVPSQECIPYSYCDNPALPNCSLATAVSPASVPSPPLPPPSAPPATGAAQPALQQ